MLCLNCKKESKDGIISNGQFICYKCEAKNLASNLTSQYKEIKDSSIINVLKKHGIPGTRAYTYYTKYSLERLIETIWLFRYKLDNGYPVKKKAGLLINMIEYPDKYQRPDRFFEWKKWKMQEFKESDAPVLYK